MGFIIKIEVHLLVAKNSTTSLLSVDNDLSPKSSIKMHNEVTSTVSAMARGFSWYSKMG